MSDKIKPSEVSQVLLEQLQGINNSQQFDEVGTVLEVSDGVARIYGLRNAEANELLEFENGTMAIVMNLEEDNVGCVLLGSTEGIKEGMVVKRTKRIASIRVNDNMLGRVINPLGQAIDGKGEIDMTGAFEMPLDRKAFDHEMQEQKTRAREARKALGDLGWAGVEFGKDIPSTVGVLRFGSIQKKRVVRY